ncbi:hypothetical protein MycrhDRAFT_6473 [Mycolicibacterium rhodesiae JS60]|nr:hypothetical protein MycrhDRAFT_6473 [Mycolicibacterium rhodesiae JS60]
MLALIAAAAAVLELAALPADHRSVQSTLLAFLCNIGIVATTLAVAHRYWMRDRDRPPADATQLSRSADDWTPITGVDAAVLTPLADHVFGLVELAQADADLDDSAFIQMDDLRWLLGSYVLNGNRLRWLAQLPEFIASFADSHLGHQAAVLLNAIRSTNTAVAEWLLAHRVALPDPDVLDSNALFDRHDRLRIDPTTVSSDPLYLLACHIHDILETAEAFNDPDHPVVETLRVQLTKPLAAIDQELRASTAFLTDAGAWLGTAPSIEAA